jgi:hypothetical protein
MVDEVKARLVVKSSSQQENFTPNSVQWPHCEWSQGGRPQSRPQWGIAFLEKSSRAGGDH